MNPVVFSYHLNIYNELKVIIGLFENGLEKFHLRKPEMNLDEYRNIIKSIPSEFHNRIMIHSHFELFNEFDLLGYYIFANKRDIFIHPEGNYIRSTFCYQFDEIEKLESHYNYTMIGPVFKSISVKEQYGSFSHEYLQEIFNSKKYNTKVVAIGGIKEDTTEIALNYGFDSVAVLGSIWATYMESLDVKKAIDTYVNIRNVSLVMKN